jgi:hypothetical protein
MGCIQEYALKLVAERIVYKLVSVKKKYPWCLHVITAKKPVTFLWKLPIPLKVHYLSAKLAGDLPRSIYRARVDNY